MEFEKAMKELSAQLNKTVTEVRERSDQLQEKYDALDVDAIKKMSDSINTLGQQISDVDTMKAGQQKTNEHVEAIKQQLAVIAAAGFDVDTKGKKTSQHAKAFNAYLRQASNADAYKAHRDAVADEIIAKDFHGVPEEDKDFIKKTMFAGNDGNGGFLVPTEFGGIIIGRVFETSPIRRVANIVTTSTKEMEFVLDDDEAGASFVGEVEARATTGTPTIASIVIPVHELFAKPKVTQGLLDDSGTDIEAFLAQKVADRFARRENNAFVVGDGSKKPEGFLNLPAWGAAGVYERFAVEQVNSGTSGDFDGNSFKKLKGSLTETYQPNAVWMMKREVWSEVTQLQDNDGRFLFELISNFRDGDTLQILGRPVILADDMPASAADSLSVTYGDFRQGYTIVDRIGIRVLRDPFSSKPFVEFYTTKRVGGAVTNFEAFKIMKLAA